MDDKTAISTAPTLLPSTLLMGPHTINIVRRYSKQSASHQAPLSAVRSSDRLPADHNALMALLRLTYGSRLKNAPKNLYDLVLLVLDVEPLEKPLRILELGATLILFRPGQPPIIQTLHFVSSLHYERAEIRVVTNGFAFSRGHHGTWVVPDGATLNVDLLESLTESGSNVMPISFGLGVVVKHAYSLLGGVLEGDLDCSGTAPFFGLRVKEPVPTGKILLSMHGKTTDVKAIAKNADGPVDLHPLIDELGLLIHEESSGLSSVLDSQDLMRWVPGAPKNADQLRAGNMAKALKIEFDGPYHCSANDSHIQGTSILKALEMELGMLVEEGLAWEE
ncbi:hypothetical protein M427DRAFT_30159 [Gonapodya prolifera JEL478]|uniref:Uncharacterized protein n=1 Tax=Gonapodya prolifera (strain JEL478) TaxID=1344416 RepID=A0A139ALK7_GONPJ|nr:hypothetical protein M427DRAFT_30159 [Gonapodya prolifera JEL478]|eukprot:KXS17672.1 hypothetical protein M427DRAFT_30159 [Gonapodya prolifera JEL478]